MEIKDFIDAGYKKYPAGPCADWAECLLQKKIVDKSYYTKYFLNVYPSRITGKLRFTLKTQLYRKKDTIDLTIHEIESIKHGEDFIEEMWNKMDMDFDHHN